MDTLSSGEVVVHNTADPLWRPGEEWQVTEDLRIGTVEGDGPDMFGQISSLALDGAGRMWVLEGQAQELRVFDAAGTYVRTVGRQGGGPGEFNQAIQVRLGPDGNIWVMDPQNNRFSVFDTAGTYLEGKHVVGGFIIIPWPGDFDSDGNYYGPVPLPSDDIFQMGLTKFDSSFSPVDTLSTPDDPVEREYFEMHNDDGGVMMASVPFSGSMTWKLNRDGTIWSLLTGDYRLTQFSQDGDTLRVVTKAFDPLPVTDDDLERAEERLDWFVRQGGKIDLTKVPSTKPATQWFFSDDVGDLWVVRTLPNSDEARDVDVFDPDGRFLGTLTFPFAIRRNPAPIIQGNTMWAITQDDLEVPYVVRARIAKPGT